MFIIFCYSLVLSSPTSREDSCWFTGSSQSSFMPLLKICLYVQCRRAHFMSSIGDGSQSLNCPMDEEKTILSSSHETGDSKTQ